MSCPTCGHYKLYTRDVQNGGEYFEWFCGHFRFIKKKEEDE